MLLKASPPPNSPHSESKMFISQPRRIAAKALVERLRNVEPDFRDHIALRMGHGVRGTVQICYSIAVCVCVKKSLIRVILCIDSPEYLKYFLFM
jgi:hypothetical protein